MIRVIRPAVGPDALEDAAGVGKREASRVASHYHDPATAGQPYKHFHAYKDPTVEAALNALFQKKCAYCETNYQAAHSMQVEHYRPKGAVEVNGVDQPPGYFWLAAAWKNLLPSCIHCNSAEYLERYDGTIHKMGKGTKFPLADERARAKKPGDEAMEQPLLLNPCDDDPSLHLAFEPDGMIRGLSPAGWQSIEVYGLWRLDLVKKRAERAETIRHHVKKIEQHLLRIQDKKAQGINYQENLDDLKDEVQALKGYLRDEREFLAMARTMAEPILQKVNHFSQVHGLTV